MFREINTRNNILSMPKFGSKWSPRFNTHAAPRARNPPQHDDVIKWKHFRRYWPFVSWIHRSPVNSPHKGPVTRSFGVSLISARIHGWVNNRQTGDLRDVRPHYDVTVMITNSHRANKLNGCLVYRPNKMRTINGLQCGILDLIYHYVILMFKGV